MHLNGLGGHFGRDKTFGLVNEKFFCPNMRRDMKRLVTVCRVCQMEKGGSKIHAYVCLDLFQRNHGLIFPWILS